MVNYFTFVLRRDAGDEALLFCLGDSELVVRVLDVGRQVVPRRGLLLAGPHEVLDVVEVDAREVGAPGRHGLLLEQPQALEAALEHPLRLALLLRDVADDGLVEPALGRGTGDVGVGPAELVGAETFELVGGRRHDVGLPVGMNVVQTPSPWAMVASRWTCTSRSRPMAAVSASQSWWNSV